MSSEAEKENPTVQPQLEIASSSNHRPTVFREPPATSRSEAQLRFRVSELEARLAEVTRCLEAAENRTAEVQTEVESVKVEAGRQLAVIFDSKSWRLTEPLRSAGRRIRSLIKG